jgi:hypothetical protein
LDTTLLGALLKHDTAPPSSDTHARIDAEFERLKQGVISKVMECVETRTKGGGSGAVERPTPEVPDAPLTDFSFKPRTIDARGSESADKVTSASESRSLFRQRMPRPRDFVPRYRR